jgi:hypothetical protein
MKAPKESQSERAQRIAANEGGIRFRSKTWSKTGKDKCPKALRRKAKKHLA